MSALPREARHGHWRAHPDTFVRAARPHEHAAIGALQRDANREFRDVPPTRVFHAYTRNPALTTLRHHGERAVNPPTRIPTCGT